MAVGRRLRPAALLDTIVSHAVRLAHPDRTLDALVVAGQAAVRVIAVGMAHDLSKISVKYMPKYRRMSVRFPSISVRISHLVELDAAVDVVTLAGQALAAALALVVVVAADEEARLVLGHDRKVLPVVLAPPVLAVETSRGNALKAVHALSITIKVPDQFILKIE